MARTSIPSRVLILGLSVVGIVGVALTLIFVFRSASPSTGRLEAAPLPPTGTPYLAPGAGHSPIPEPGETISAKLPPRRLDAGQAQATQPIPIDMKESELPPGVIPWYAAPRSAGKEVTIQGAVVRTYNTGKVCFINFSPDRNVPFYLFMFAADYDQFSQPPEKFFLRKTLRVKGKVEPYGDKFEIVIRSKDQVEVVK